MGKVKVKKYERAIIDLMQKYRFSAENDEAHIIADSLNHHYKVLRTGTQYFINISTITR